MNFGKKGLKLASVLMGTMLMGGVLAGCGSQADSNEIKVGANFEMTGNVANYGAATLDGVKFRTRAQAGRCHGGFCTARIMKIMQEELGLPAAALTKRGPGSEIVKGERL